MLALLIKSSAMPLKTTAIFLQQTQLLEDENEYPTLNTSWHSKLNFFTKGLLLFKFVFMYSYTLIKDPWCLQNPTSTHHLQNVYLAGVFPKSAA